MLTKNQEDILDEIVTRYYGRVTKYDVFKWLQQFKTEDYDLGLDVLLKLDFFSVDDIYTQLNIHFPKVINRVENYYKFLKLRIDESLKESQDVKILALAKRQLKDLSRRNPIFITGIGSYGKSGTAMMYYVTHTPFYRENKKLFTVIDNSNRLNIKHAFNLTKDQTPILSRNLNLQILIIDDIIGSGGSLVKYIKNELDPQMKSIGMDYSVHVLSLINLKEGISNVKNELPEVNIYFYGEVVEKSFSYKSKVFGYQARREKVKKFAESYGRGLYVSGKPNPTDFPLGHQDSQMLVVFPHSTPNNTLPIIWSNKNGWYPLFPRSTYKRIGKSKQVREEIGLWTSIASRLKLNKYTVANNIYDSKNIQMLCLVKLLHEGKSINYIISELGLFENDLYDIITLSQQNGLIDDDLNLTEYARMIYKEVRKEIRRASVKKKDFSENNVLYLPKTFRGFT